MAPALRASIAAGPALKTCVLSLVCAEVLGDEPLVDTHQGRGVGDVAEVAEPEFGGRAGVRRGRCRGGFRAAGQRGCHGCAGADQEHKPRDEGDLQGALAFGFAGLAGDDPGGAGLALSRARGFRGCVTWVKSCSGVCAEGPGGWSAPATSPLEVPAGEAGEPFRCLHSFTIGSVIFAVQRPGNRGSRGFTQRHIRKDGASPSRRYRVPAAIADEARECHILLDWHHRHYRHHRHEGKDETMPFICRSSVAHRKPGPG